MSDHSESSQISRNPFCDSDPDRYAIWDMLVHRDIHAYVDADWSNVEDDFVDSGFFGVNANGSNNPDKWSLDFPSLELYRNQWLTSAENLRQQSEPEIALKDIFAATNLDDIRIIDSHMATAHKKFNGYIRLTDGDRRRLYLQTLYVCRKVDDCWKINSFVGYLPLHD